MQNYLYEFRANFLLVQNVLNQYLNLGIFHSAVLKEKFHCELLLILIDSQIDNSVSASSLLLYKSPLLQCSFVFTFL